MNDAALVEILARIVRLLDHFHCSGLPRLLVVLDAVTRNQYKFMTFDHVSTYRAAIFRFRLPRIAFDKCVKNSVFSRQLSSGSGSCGEPTPMENQSSRKVEVLTYLIAPRGMVRSVEMDSCWLTTACTTM